MNLYAFHTSKFVKLEKDYMEQAQGLSHSLSHSLSQQQLYTVWELVIPYATPIIGNNEDSFSNQMRIAGLCRVCTLFNKIIIARNWFGREIWQEYIEKYDMLKKEVIITWKDRFRSGLKSFMKMDDLNIELEILDLRPNRNGELLAIRQKIEKRLRSKESLQKIMDLFGGETKFKNIPVIDATNLDRRTAYIDWIKPTDMSHPVMRGIDAINRIFIVIRYRDIETNRYHCQVIFQRYINDYSDWASDCNKSIGSGYLVNFGGYLIDDGCIINESAYNKLQEALQIRHVRNYGAFGSFYEAIIE